MAIKGNNETINIWIEAIRCAFPPKASTKISCAVNSNPNILWTDVLLDAFPEKTKSRISRELERTPSIDNTMNKSVFTNFAICAWNTDWGDIDVKTLGGVWLDELPLLNESDSYFSLISKFDEEHYKFIFEKMISTNEVINYSDWIEFFYNIDVIISKIKNNNMDFSEFYNYLEHVATCGQDIVEFYKPAYDYIDKYDIKKLQKNEISNFINSFSLLDSLAVIVTEEFTLEYYTKKFNYLLKEKISILFSSYLCGWIKFEKAPLFYFSGIEINYRVACREISKLLVSNDMVNIYDFPKTPTRSIRYFDLLKENIRFIAHLMKNCNKSTITQPIANYICLGLAEFIKICKVEDEIHEKQNINSLKLNMHHLDNEVLNALHLRSIYKLLVESFGENAYDDLKHILLNGIENKSEKMKELELNFIYLKASQFPIYELESHLKKKH